MVRSFARRALPLCAAAFVVLLAWLPGLAVPEHARQPQLRPPVAIPDGVQIVKRRAKVHGPFLPERRRLTIPAPVDSGEGDELLAGVSLVPCRTADCGGVAPIEGSPDDRLSPALTSGPCSTEEISGSYPQIAASRAVLAIASDSMIGFYDKAGGLLQKRPNQIVGTQIVVYPAFPIPLSAAQFFSVLWADPNANINQALNLPPGFCDPSQPALAGSFCFDSTTICAWSLTDTVSVSGLGALVKNTENKEEKWENDPEKRTARRDAFAIAVSRTADPRDGWYYYWIAAVGDAWRCNYPDNPETNPALCGDYWPGDGADYESIGISLQHFVMGVSVKNGSNPVLVEREQKSRYAAVFALDADQLADGSRRHIWCLA